MPIFEFRCRACAWRFESLLAKADAAAPDCPSCRSADVERLLSAFAVVGSRRAPEPGPCGSSGCGCRSN